MSTEVGEDAVVTYSVKDLLGEIRDDVKEMKSSLDHKVDKTDFITLEGRVKTLEEAWWKSKGFILAIATSGLGAGFGIERLFS
jgi:hypothetical protein